MQSTFETAFAAVQALAKDFEENRRHYLSPGYQESEVRKDFIDKFLIALGWDVHHDWQKNPFEQEVKVERGVTMQGAQKRADYAFFVSPNFRDVRFFVEAKKPFGDIASAQNYFQTIRYGWNAQTPVAVLTDFEQFQILDCRCKPDVDTALSHCIQKFHFSEYADQEKFAVIYHLFSRDAVAAGSLDKFAAELPKKRGKAVQRGLFKGGWQNIDEAFLEELDGYRDVLARSFKNKNPALDGDALTEITQRTIDRLVFIRFLEDKMIHPENLISEFGNKATAWKDFIAASRKLDGIYNGIVFKQHTILDAPGFKVDDGEFAGICEKLAHVNSPYDFNSIPIHILGSIYERFLGKVIVTTAKRATLEEKPEVRKAGGVYYTPEYIVRYIVENTVGKQIEGKTPAQIADMRFADIACGSGSFLLGVFDLLLSYHGKWFNANPNKARKAGCVLGDDGAWHLSLKQRREILVNNLYGVDIDNQAVEVAQLSLYLKLLEEETTASARQHQLEFHETILPSLNKNIVCGNSLIGTDIETGQFFAGEEERKLNPMDYKQRFPEIMKRGGFDAIVGNPPYGADFTPLTKDYFQHTYVYKKGKPETYIYFLERAVTLLNKNGKIGYITPNAWLTNYYGVQIRGYILSNTTIEQVVDLEPTKVFAGAVVDTAIMIMTRGKSAMSHNKAQVLRGTKDFKILPYCELHQSTWANDSEFVINLQANPIELALLERLESSPRTLGDFVDYSQGAIPYKTKHDGEANLHISALQQSSKWLPLFENASQVERYQIGTPRAFIHYGPWLWCAREQRFFSEPKILFHRLRKKLPIQLVGMIDESGAINRHSLSNLILKPNVAHEALWGLLALFNSKLSNWWFVKRYGLLMEVGGFKVSKLPLPKRWDEAQTSLVLLVGKLIEAKKQLAAAQSDKDKDFYGHKCESLDRQIDALIYELYGLT
ncbi:MAG: N-6 DNA methylase, partial [Kiritimatiellales bacterium]